MPISFIDYNGKLIPEKEAILTSENRSFRYGDGLFETMRWMDGDVRFLDYHIERLQNGMALLHMNNPERFDAQFIRTQAEKLIRKNNLESDHVRLRLHVFRDGGGLYSPSQNKASYVLGCSKLDKEELRHRKLGLIVDVYPEYRKAANELSGIKSANALVYVMAGLYRKNKGLDDVVILNQDGYVCESLSSNVFFWYEKRLYTPAISEGCIAGVMRRVVIEMALDSGLEVVEAQIHPDIMREADEIFHTNAIQGVQWVMGYKQKRYFNRISRTLQEKLADWSPGE